MGRSDPGRRWVDELCRANASVDARTLSGAIADRVAAALGIPPVVGRAPSLTVPAGPLAGGGSPPVLDDGGPPGGWNDPWLVGAVHERAERDGSRRRRGAWYTPRPVVDGLLALAVDEVGVPARIVDPTCGGGAFLLAGLDLLAATGIGPVDAVGRVAGMDLDPDAVTVSEWSIRLWLAARLRRAGADPDETAAAVAALDVAVEVGDALVDRTPWWGQGPVLVAGNPPFASPLRAGVIPASAVRYRDERTGLLGPYADLAARHLLRAVELSAPGSAVALVLPQSVLAGRDTDDLRRHIDTVAPLRALWAAREAVFDAGVRACAVVAVVGADPPATVALAAGPTVERRGRRPAGRWTELATAALGAPDPTAMGERTLGELVTATAGFRDEHYGLVAACREEADLGPAPRLVTVGLVDPLHVGWGHRRCRFGGLDRQRPVIDRAALDIKVAAWFERRARPKVLLATQSKVLEPVVDRVGDLVPATPLIAVHADPDDLDRVAAVLLAPPVTLWAWQRWFGAALAVDALKLAARQVAELPLPSDDGAWAEAAAVVAAADGADAGDGWSAAVAVAEIMTAAYGAPTTVFDWWRRRLGPRPGS
ncbi:MAG: hypothetical protein ACFCVK_16685 [Acidimicrobiales bacterium]